jgi:hypothetical protein
MRSRDASPFFRNAALGCGQSLSQRFMQAG